MRMVQKLPGLPGLNSVMAPPMWRCFFRVSVDLCIWLGFPFYFVYVHASSRHYICFFTRFTRSSLLMHLHVLRSERIVVEPWCCWEFTSLHVLFWVKPFYVLGNAPLATCLMFWFVRCILFYFNVFKKLNKPQNTCAGDQ